MQRFCALVGLLSVAICAVPAAVWAQGQGTPAKAALVVDITSGAVLLEKNADRPIPPASMSKLMTLFMVFEALEQGVLSMDDTFRTSKRASAMGGSKMFLREGDPVSVRNMIRGVIVASGNDAAVALAEALAGTEEAFAERMNARAQEIGLTGSTFANATGWPHPNHRMTAHDLVTLATAIVTRFADHYTMFTEREITWDGVQQQNRNPLLGLSDGVDGMKTGHTQEAGYGLVSSAKRGARRVIVVLSGLESGADRRQEAERLVNWTFRAFETRRLYAQGDGLIEAPVWIGASDTVTLAPARDVTVTAPSGTLDRATLQIRYDGPIQAPIQAGQAIGWIEIAVPELAPVSVPLVAKHSVAEGGFIARVHAAAQLLLQSVLPDGWGFASAAP